MFLKPKKRKQKVSFIHSNRTRPSIWTKIVQTAAPRGLYMLAAACRDIIRGIRRGRGACLRSSYQLLNNSPGGHYGYGLI